MEGKILAMNALLPLMAKLMSRVACALAESVTINSGVYVPCPPISELLITPVEELRDIPSGNGANPEPPRTENE